jgi:hypothetical protein
MLGEYHKPQKCKECDYSDFCDLIEVPSEEVCEAIRACAKDFLYEKLWESLYEYFTKKEKLL